MPSKSIINTKVSGIQPVYFGIDPSLSGFGIAIINKNTQTIILDELKADDHHNFIMMCWAIENMYNDFIERYQWFLNEHTCIAQELPISAGINSGKLNALGIYFYSNLGHLSKYQNIKVYHPIKLKSFHHKKKYDKKDTMIVVDDVLNMFRKIGYTIDIRYSRTKKSSQITNNEADAMMYAIKTYIDRNPDSYVTRDILEKYPRFSVIISLNEEKSI